MTYDGQFQKKKGFFYSLPNLIKMKKFEEQLNILKGDDGHFFAQRFFGSQSLHRKKKSCNFLCWNGQECNTFFAMKIKNPFLTS